MNALLEQLTKIAMPKKIAVLFVLIVLVAGGYYYFMYMDIAQELETLSGQHAQLQTQLAQAQRKKSTYDKDRHRRDELKKSYAQQLRALPADAEMSSFLNSLNSQAEMVGLELLSVKPKREEPAQYYARIPVELTLSGNFLQMAKFFYLVSSVDRIINIENINFKVKGASESGIKLSAEVLATTFRSVEIGKPPSTGKKKKG